MDPLTQGVLGASASLLVSNRREKFAAAVLGFFSGMAADLDVLISSSTDPLLFLEFHRHFTHALMFIPIGALLCTFVFRCVFKSWFVRQRMSFSRTYLFCFAGYATHALLDGCTTYGTQLFWPFSDMRVAWNNVSVIDPLFTLPLLIVTVFAVIKRSGRAAVIGGVYVFTYLGLGVVQNNRAESVAFDLATSRGHYPSALGVKPSFANMLVWKSVYTHKGRYYVDAIRVGFESKIYQGESTKVLELTRDFSWLEPLSQQAKDVERFRWFSNDHLGIDPQNSNRIIDVRYSLVPNELSGMWGIVLSEQADKQQHVAWTSSRPKGDRLTQKTDQLWQMVLGR